MAADWRTKREAIRQAVSWALRVPQLPSVLLADGTSSNDHLVAWEGQNTANRWTTGLWCDLRMNWVLTVGRDETRQEFDENAQTLMYRYGGQRRFVVTAIIGTDDQTEMDAVGSATQSLRTLIRHPHAHALLGAADIGLGRIRRTMWADYTAHGVRYSASHTEFEFNTYEEFLETAPEFTGANSWVDRVETLPDGEGRFKTGHDGEDIIRHIDVEVEP